MHSPQEDHRETSQSSGVSGTGASKGETVNEAHGGGMRAEGGPRWFGVRGEETLAFLSTVQSQLREDVTKRTS